MTKRFGSGARRELAIAMSQELYPHSREKRRKYVKWKLGKGGR